MKNKPTHHNEDETKRSKDVGLTDQKVTTKANVSTIVNGSSVSATTTAQPDASLEASAPKEGSCERYASCRWTLAYMAGLMTLLVALQRQCISMAIVCMSNLKYEPDGESNCTDCIEGSAAENVTSQSTGGMTVTYPDYIPDTLQGVVLSSYSYGHIFTPFIGGMIAERLGGKRVLTVATVLVSALTLLTPAAIRLHVYLAVCMRVLLGLTTGFCLPSMMSMWSHWAPPGEKAKLLTLTFSGVGAGSIVTNLASGFLCSIPVDEGWPFIFYTYGGLIFVWAIVWQFVAYDRPDVHPRIQEKERSLFRKKTPPNPNGKKFSRPPLKAIFTSKPFLALLFTHLCHAWFVNITTTYLPLYLNDILHFDTETNGVLSSLPFMFRLAGNVLFAMLSDNLISRGKLTVTQCRKLFQGIGAVVPAAVLLGVGFLPTDRKYEAVAMMVVSALFQAASLSGFRINHLDIAPRFAGSLAGLTVSFAMVANIINPLIISPLIVDKRQESWRTAFTLSSTLSCVGALVFALFGSGKEQQWAKEESQFRTVTSGVVPIQNGSTSGTEGRYANIEIEMEIPEDGPSFEKGKLNFAFVQEDKEGHAGGINSGQWIDRAVVTKDRKDEK